LFDLPIKWGAFLILGKASEAFSKIRKMRSPEAPHRVIY